MASAAWLDELVQGNAAFVKEEWQDTQATMPAPPSRQLAVVACMDTRHVIETILGLRIGEAKIIRNAGPVMDEGTLRSLKVAVYALGVKRILVMGHSACGMTKLAGIEDLADQIRERADPMRDDDTSTAIAKRWGAFPDPVGNVRSAVQTLFDEPELPNDVEVAGAVYDNATGKVEIVFEAGRLGELANAT